jgi:protease-4
MSVETPLHANVKATMNTLPDNGPLAEVVVPCGPNPGPAGCEHKHTSKVAVLDIDGLLVNNDPVGPYSMGENPVALFQEKLDAAAADPAVKAVVLRINSPGGSVAASEAMVRSLADFRRATGKPVVACLLDEGAGGAYFLASGCDQIVAMPSSVVGGIGVILNLYFLELAMEQWNVFGTPIKSGDRIDMGTPIRKMTAPEKQQLTAMATEYHSNFKRAVLSSRPQVKADSPAFDGRVLATSQAQAEGLIDGVGFLPDAIDRARQLVKQEAVLVVMYRRPESPARSLYATVPNRPVPVGAVPVSIPGLDRSKLPLFLYMWQADPTMVRVVSP